MKNMFESDELLTQTSLEQFKKDIKVGDVLAYPFERNGKTFSNLNVYSEVSEYTYQQMQQLTEREYYLRGFAIANDKRDLIGTTAERVRCWDNLVRQTRSILKHRAFKVTITSETTRKTYICDGVEYKMPLVGEQVWVREINTGDEYHYVLLHNADTELQRTDTTFTATQIKIDKESWDRMNFDR
jgi:hypothetical protein